METDDKNFVFQAAEIIENGFPMLAGIDDLADRLAVSKCHLIRCFSRERGISPGKYLVRIRLAAVMEYLRDEDYTVDTIAGLTGFACGNYLAKVFRKAVGCTPCDYRRNAQKNIPRNNAPMRRAEDISFL